MSINVPAVDHILGLVQNGLFAAFIYLRFRYLSCKYSFDDVSSRKVGCVRFVLKCYCRSVKFSGKRYMWTTGSVTKITHTWPYFSNLLAGNLKFCKSTERYSVDYT